ncbi:HAD-IA family hydrolase [Candidatus Woesearchaeota archaeon]|nr:HAD-IA family hydrolase [Candidatus Woesearchaeota archaeon]
MIKTIFCDLGNVIVFFNQKLIAQGLAKYSSKNAGQIYRFFISSRARKSFDIGKISEKTLFKSFKKNLHLKTSLSQFKKIWPSCFTSLNRDMVSLLYSLKKRYKLVLLSNTDPIHYEYCRKKYSVLEIFDDFVLSYKTGLKKPNPLIYLYALKKAKALPNQVLYIDDVCSYIATAKIFGIKSLQYKNMNKLKRDMEHLKIKIYNNKKAM